MQTIASAFWHAVRVIALLAPIAVAGEPSRAAEPHAPLDVVTVTSGPRYTTAEGLDARFRVIVLSSEIYLSIEVEQIAYGDEGCCAELKKQFALDSKQLGGSFTLTDTSDFRWIDYQTFEFRGNSTLFRVSNLSKDPTVERIPSKP